MLMLPETYSRQAVTLMAACHLLIGEARAIHEVGAGATESEHELIHDHVLQQTRQRGLSQCPV